MKEMFLLMECQYAIIVGISMMLGLSVSSLALKVLLILQEDLSLEKSQNGPKCSMFTAQGMRAP